MANVDEGEHRFGDAHRTRLIRLHAVRRARRAGQGTSDVWRALVAVDGRVDGGLGCMRDDDLPPGWAEASVQDLASPEPRPITDGPFGSNLKTAHYTPEGPRVIRLQNIGELRFVDDRAHISQEHFESLSAHSVRPNDVLIAGLGEQLPRSCLAPSFIGSAIVKADCFRVRTHPEIVPAYLCALLHSPQVRSASSARISGVGRPRLNLHKVREIRIPVPPTKEQERIVAAIEEQFSRLGAGVAALKRVQQNLKRMRAALLQAAVTGRLDDHSARQGDSNLPVGWQTVPVGDVAEVSGGITKNPKRRPDKTPIPFLRVANVHRYGLNLTEVHQIEVFEGELDRMRLRPGDLLVVEGNGSPDQIGRSALWGGEIDPCVHQNHLIRVRPSSLVVPAYLNLYSVSYTHLRAHETVL